ncbi:uncharacterized protein [Triticum aestivum]|uniref:uncharacterized protein n=1 Tax=Triticum aestivum TaxID=4565 RepID=UPI001D005455|nr:uncharacterized protein LOC123185050 [Triticum aestivum]
MAERPERCPPGDATSRQFPGPTLTAAGGTIAMSADRRNTPSPLHDGIGLEGQPRPPLAVLPQSEAELSSRKSGVAMPESHTVAWNDDHGGSTSGLHHVNLVDDNSRCFKLYRPSYTMSEATTCTMDLPPPQVMSGGGQQDDAVTDGRGENGEQTIQVPEVGKTFESEKDAYDMYNTYAGKVGFSIRKNQTKHRHDGTIYQKRIVCSNQGHRETESSKDATRTDCNARIQFSVSREGIWTVQKVVADHNHYLASPNKVHKLRSQRRVIEADRHLIGQIREAGMKPS